MKRNTLLIVLWLLISCSKKDNNTLNNSTSKTIEYSVWAPASDANITLAYTDSKGTQVGVGSVKSGWTHTETMTSGNTANMQASVIYPSTSYKVVSIIKLNGTVVATDTSEDNAQVQYVIK